MPAYVQHREVEQAVMVCPSCMGFPMHVSDVQPHWSMERIDFMFECGDCGAGITRTVIKPPRKH